MRVATLLTKVCQFVGIPCLLGITLLLSSGCDPDPYPADMEYPVRRSTLVIGKPDVHPDIQAFPSLGQMPTTIPTLYAQGTGELVDPMSMPEKVRDDIQTTMRSLFGKPSQPGVFSIPPGQLKKIFGTPRNNLATTSRSNDAIVDVVYQEGLIKGSKLYRRHCLHCHGVSGNGHGPTAAWVNPHPRDYRRGMFKFTSTMAKQKPLNSDLYRTLYEGVEGTSMPSFKVLPPEELDALVAYVIHLSMRGEVEYNLYKIAKTDSSLDVKVQAQVLLNDLATAWAEPKVVPVVDYAETTVGKALEAAKDSTAKADAIKASAGRGYKVFLNEGQCIACHMNFGRAPKFLVDNWGALVKPRNLTEGVFRGGRRPIDIYYRIYAGIDPAGMGGRQEGDPLTSDPNKIWDLVNFVRALPYENMLPDDVKNKIYGK